MRSPRAWLFVCCLLAGLVILPACHHRCGDGDDVACIYDYDSDAGTDIDRICDLVTQSGCAPGEKCTWRLGEGGFVACAPAGSNDVGASCTPSEGQFGYDSCAAGSLCVDGTCKALCDVTDGAACGSGAACALFPDLYPPASPPNLGVGVCVATCDPLTANDFDGAGSASEKTSTACGTDPAVGCYGSPSGGHPPATSWSCMKDVNANLEQASGGFRHGRRCDGHCAVGPRFWNGCNQGYIPALHELNDVSIVYCAALCKPLNCYAGNCGANDENRLGEAPHRCTNPDRVGTFDTSPGGEHCRFLWSVEVSETEGFVPSPSSDALGFCEDHTRFPLAGAPQPACATLPDGFGSGSALGAADLGCVDTVHAGIVPGQVPRRLPAADVRLLGTSRD